VPPYGALAVAAAKFSSAVSLTVGASEATPRACSLSWAQLARRAAAKHSNIYEPRCFACLG